MPDKTSLTNKCKSLGEARLKIAAEAKTPEDWERLWNKPAHDYPFKWGDCWKQCIEYFVDDFVSEVGFFIDILGFPPNAFDKCYAMFTSPDRAFYFSIACSTTENKTTPPDSIRIQFMIDDILATAAKLENRGIVFEKKPTHFDEVGSPLFTGFFRSPNGVRIDLWGMVDTED